MTDQPSLANAIREIVEQHFEHGRFNAQRDDFQEMVAERVKLNDEATQQIMELVKPSPDVQNLIADYESRIDHLEQSNSTRAQTLKRLNKKARTNEARITELEQELKRKDDEFQSRYKFHRIAVNEEADKRLRATPDENARRAWALEQALREIKQVFHKYHEMPWDKQCYSDVVEELGNVFYDPKTGEPTAASNALGEK